MNINEYSLIEGSRGYGYIDDPYIMDDLYIRGDSSVTWIISGTGRFSINLSDIDQRVYAEDTAYHVISVYVNGILSKVDASRTEKTTEFGVTVSLEDATSEVELVFNCDNNNDSMTHVSKLSSFINKYKPETESTTTTTEEPEELGEGSEEWVKQNGLRIASVDFSNTCGAYSTSLSPDTGEFHFIGGEVWFTGSREIERSYIVKVTALDANNQIISSKDLNFAIQGCNSSEPCSTGGGSGGDSDGEDVDDSISPPSNISVTTQQCGTLDGETVIKDSFSWSGDSNVSNVFDVQFSFGNSFSILERSYTAISGTYIEEIFTQLNQIMFMRVRQRDQISGKVSDWSGVLTFNTNQLAECDDTVTPPIDKVFQEVSCRESVPAGETEEDETEEETETTTPTDKEDTGNPSPGPDVCSGSGCGESEDGNTGSNPNNPGYWPCCQTNPGCIGPGCDPDSSPEPPGSSPDDPEGTPGGPDGPEGEKPPSVPPPTKPICDDDSIHLTTFEGVNEDDTKNVEFVITWNDGADNGRSSCEDYLNVINKKHLEEVVSTILLAPGESTGIVDLGQACPECLDVCVRGDSGEASYKITTTSQNPDGSFGTPYVDIASTEISKPVCTCENLSISDVYPDVDITEGDFRYRVRITSNDAAQVTYPAMAMLRQPNSNEGCFTFERRVDRIAGGTGSQQSNKLLCYACSDRGEWIDVTSDIIGCEIPLNQRREDSGKYVSYPDHWLMSANTYEIANMNDWPNTDFISWGPANLSPFKSKGGWEFTGEFCVACCKIVLPGEDISVGNPNDRLNPVITGLAWGDLGISQQVGYSQTNNISCIEDEHQMRDPTLGGYAVSNDGTYAPPCSLIGSYYLSDSSNKAGGLHGTDFQEHGFAEVTIDEVNAITDAPNCRNCTTTVNYDYTYLITKTEDSLVCSGGNGSRNMIYNFYQDAGLSDTAYVSMSERSLGPGGEPCGGNQPAPYSSYTSNQRAYNRMYGSWVIPFGEEPNGDYWTSVGANGWGPSTSLIDGSTPDPARWSLEMNFSSYTSFGPGNGNPLP